MRRRWLVLLFPWPALRSLRMLAENQFSDVATDGWDRGYDRAMYEVGLNIGICRDRHRVEYPNADEFLVPVASSGKEGDDG